MRRHAMKLAAAHTPSAPGAALEPNLRASFEPLFGHDFANVRVHDGAAAQRLTQIQAASAATIGSDIYLAQPLTPQMESRYLIAHELTHVVQNNRAGQDVPKQQRSSRSTGSETEARDSAVSVLSGSRVNVQSAPDALIACEDPAPFNISLLPPEMRLRLGGFGMNADTSAASIQLGSDTRGFDAGYHYGGDITAGLHFDGFKAGLGVNPGSGALSLDGSYRDFNFGANLDPRARSGGFHLGYGAPLLPDPSAFSNTMMAGGNGLTGAVGALPGGIADPLAYYRAQSSNISAVTSAVGAAGDLATSPTQSWGVGLTGSVTPEEQRVMLGAGFNF